jgi:uncharacterized protein (TIGR03084 family)
MPNINELIHDLRAEYSRLAVILGPLSDSQWNTESAAPGWTVLDVVIHLAITEEQVAKSIAGNPPSWTKRVGSLDEQMAAEVRTNQAKPRDVLRRWERATSASLSALNAADPDFAIAWASTPLRPVTLATTRLAEHWSHGLDITTALEIAFPDTDRLRHIAWLGLAALPYGCRLIGIEPQPLRVELIGPNNQTWTYGPPDASSKVAGLAADFCRVGAQRLAPADSGLITTGPFADLSLKLLRNYPA